MVKTRLGCPYAWSRFSTFPAPPPQGTSSKPQAPLPLFLSFASPMSGQCPGPSRSQDPSRRLGAKTSSQASTRAPSHKWSALPPGKPQPHYPALTPHTWTQVSLSMSAEQKYSALPHSHKPHLWSASFSPLPPVPIVFTILLGGNKEPKLKAAQTRHPCKKPSR